MAGYFARDHVNDPRSVKSIEQAIEPVGRGDRIRKIIIAADEYRIPADRAPGNRRGETGRSLKRAAGWGGCGPSYDNFGACRDCAQGRQRLDEPVHAARSSDGNRNVPLIADPHRDIREPGPLARG